MLRALDIQAVPVARPLMNAANLIRDGRSHDTPRTFLRPTSKWHRYLYAQPRGDKRLWEVAVLSHLRDGFRSGDLWLPRFRRHGDPTQALVPLPTSTIDTALAVPLDVGMWLADRQAWMALGLERLAKTARTASIPGGVIRDGGLNIDRLTAEAPEGVDELILDLYKRLPETRITDLLVEVDDEVGFTDAFLHLRTGAPCKDRIGLMNVLLAEGINLSLGKMADSTNTHDYWELMRLSRWHVEGEAFARALEIVIDAQARLPMAKFWGPGSTASSDGQFFPTTRQGEAMNLVNARYGNEPGLKAYTHVSDRFGPFATQVIPAAVGEAPYILDGLLMNETGRRIREQYADTGGFTDHVFAVTSILGYRFVPRIRDLPCKRIYVFEPATCPKELRGLIGGKLRQSLIALNWPDILRLGATLAAGTVAPSLILRKLAAYPRRNDLAAVPCPGSTGGSDPPGLTPGQPEAGERGRAAPVRRGRRPEPCSGGSRERCRDRGSAGPSQAPGGASGSPSRGASCLPAERSGRPGCAGRPALAAFLWDAAPPPRLCREGPKGLACQRGISGRMASVAAPRHGVPTPPPLLLPPKQRTAHPAPFRSVTNSRQGAYCPTHPTAPRRTGIAARFVARITLGHVLQLHGFSTALWQSRCPLDSPLHNGLQCNHGTQQRRETTSLPRTPQGSAAARSLPAAAGPPQPAATLA